MHVDLSHLFFLFCLYILSLLSFTNCIYCFTCDLGSVTMHTKMVNNDCNEKPCVKDSPPKSSSLLEIGETE